MASTKNNKITNVGKNGEIGTLLHCWWKYKLEQPLWKALWRFLKKVKIEPPYDSANPLVGIYPKEMNILTQKDIRTPCSLQHLLQ